MEKRSNLSAVMKGYIFQAMYFSSTVLSIIMNWGVSLKGGLGLGLREC